MNNTTLNNQICGMCPQMNHFAYKFTQNLDDAEDLVQDTFMKAMRYANLYKEGTNLQAWVFTIMRNTFINNYRRMTKIRSVITTTEELNSFQLSVGAPRNQAEGKFIQADINLAMAALPKENYIPFIRYFEGYKYHEIAEQLEVPIGTIKTRIHVARKLLKANLKMYSDQFSHQSYAS